MIHKIYLQTSKYLLHLIKDLPNELLDGFTGCGKILQDHGAVEMAEEGLVAYFTTQFVSHERHRHNFESRPLRLDQHHSEWEDCIRFMWDDYIDDMAALDVYPVNPMPPAPPYRGTAAC